MIELINTTNNHKNLVIFIHGFIGGKETWETESGHKPLIDFLLLDTEIKKNCNVGLFIYHSKLVELYPKARILTNLLLRKKNVFNLPIEDISKLLATQLKYTYAKYENIILIGHSMGGLVAKRFILDDLKKNSSSKVKLYISLATPHSGSLIASIGNHLIHNNIQILDLKPLGESITKMNDEWVKCKTLPKRLYGQGSYDTIVQKESSVSMDRDDQEVIYSDDDHFTIIKPASPNVIIDAIAFEIKEFLKEQQLGEVKNVDSFVDDGIYDHDLFVLKMFMADIHSTLVNHSKQAFFNADFTIRKLVSLGADIFEFRDLYSKIHQLYVIEFGKLLSGEHKDPNALLTAVHERIIEKDKSFLYSLQPAIQSLQKYGMMHQLASDLNKDIWWAISHNIKTLEEFKASKKALE